MVRPLVQDLGDGKFRKQFVDPISGKQETIIASTREGAIALAEELKAQRYRFKKGIATAEETAIVMNTRRGPVSVREAWLDYEKTIRSTWLKKARSIWTHRLAPYFGEEKGEKSISSTCAELDDVALATWITSELQQVKIKTIQNAWQCLRRAVTLQIHRKRLLKLPWDDFRPPVDPDRRRMKKESARSIDEILLIAQVAHAHDRKNVEARRYTDLAARVLVVFFLGLRQGEASGLGWDDIALDVDAPHEPFVIIRHQATDGWQRENPEWERPRDAPKGKTTEKLTLHPSAVEVLRAQRENLLNFDWYRPDGPVFPGKGGKWRTHADLLNPAQFKRLAREAGVPCTEGLKWTPHSLRHSTGTLEAVASGGDVRHVQARLRHADVSTTMIYIHATDRFASKSAMVAAPEAVEAVDQLATSSPPDLPLEPPRSMLPGRVEGPRRLAEFASASPPVPQDIGEITSDVTRMLVEGNGRTGSAKERRAATVRDSKSKRRGRAIPNYATAWQEWIEASGGDVAVVRAAFDRGERPASIKAAADAAYVRGYNAELARTKQKKSAQVGGMRSKRGFLASWKRYAMKLIGDSQTQPKEEIK